MNRSEKLAVVAYIVESIPGVKLVEAVDEVPISSDDEAFLNQKLQSMTFSPRIERLFEKRQEIAQHIDLEDERTRHILGL